MWASNLARCPSAEPNRAVILNQTPSVILNEVKDLCTLPLPQSRPGLKPRPCGADTRPPALVYRFLLNALSPVKGAFCGCSENGGCNNALPSGNKPHTAAKAETTDYAPAGRRAFDSRPRCRLRPAVWYPAPRRRAPATRSRKWSVQRPSLHNIYQKGQKVNSGRSLQRP